MKLKYLEPLRLVGPDGQPGELLWPGVLERRVVRSRPAAPTLEAPRPVRLPRLWSHTVRWHEWVNRAYMPELVAQVLEAVHRFTYAEALALVRTHRPRGEERSREASAFWADFRGVAVYALLARPEGVAEVERGLGLSTSVLYHLLTDWKIRFLAFSAPPKILASGIGGEYEGHLSFSGDRYWLTLPDGAVHEVKYAHWDGWLVLNDSGPVVTAAHAVRAARLAGSQRLRQDMVRGFAVLAQSRGLRVLAHPHIPGEVLIPLTLVSEVYGPGPALAALRELNHCHCAFWSDALGKCAFAHKEHRGSDCPDFAQLEDA